jgi:hypothetical protein
MLAVEAVRSNPGAQPVENPGDLRTREKAAVLEDVINRLGHDRHGRLGGLLRSVVSCLIAIRVCRRFRILLF